jgi:small-conductance mechanosensitive channel
MGAKKEARKEREQLISKKREQLANLKAKIAEIEKEIDKLGKRNQKSVDKLKSIATYVRTKKAITEGVRIAENELKMNRLREQRNNTVGAYNRTWLEIEALKKESAT